MAAESALQAAIAGGEAINRSLLGLAETVNNNAEFQQKSILARSSILSNMAESALNLKRTQIDQWHKEESLKLDSRRLDILEKQNSIENNIKMLNANTSIAELDARKDYYEYLKGKQEKADQYSDYVSSIQKQVSSEAGALKLDEDRISSQIDSLQARIFGRKDASGKPIEKGMRSIERDRDAENPNGLQAQLNNLIKHREENFTSRRNRLKLMEDEIVNVTSGRGKPGDILPLPKGFSFESASNSPSGKEGEGMLQDNPLLPKLKTDINQKDIEAASKTLQNEQAPVEFGQLPNEVYQDPVSVKISDNKALARILDPDIPVDEAVDYIQELSPEGKQILQKKRNIYAQGYLEAVGAARKFNVKNDSSEAKDAFEHLTNSFVRAGGTREDIITLAADANEKLIELRSQFNVAGEDGIAPSEDEVDRKVANAYRLWVRDRYKEEEKNQKASITEELSTGSAILQDIGLTLELNNNISGLSEKDQIKRIMMSDSDINYEKAKLLSKDKQEEDQIIEFNKNFIDKGQFNLIKFYEFASKNPNASALLAPDVSSKNTSILTGEGIDVTQSNEKDFASFRKRQKEAILNSIQGISLVKAFEVWKNSRKKSN